MATLFTSISFRALDANGQPLAGGKLYSYASGTSTPQVTYTAADELAENTNPVILDSTGQADVFLGKGKTYKLVLCDADDVQQWEIDGIDSLADIQDIRDTVADLVANDKGMVGNIAYRPEPAANYGDVNVGQPYFALDEHKAYRSNGTTWVDVTSDLFPKFDRPGAINYVIDGGADVPATGAKGQVYIPAACTITGWTLTGDASGSAVVDVKKATYGDFPTVASICGTDKPTLATAQKARNTAVDAGVWTTALAAGDIVQFTLDSVATCKRLNLSLLVTILGE